MKKLFAYAVAIGLAGFIYSGCGDDNSSPAGGTTQTTSGTASFTLNGAGFSNQSFTVSGVIGGFEDNQTGLAGGNPSAENQAVLNIGFPGSSTGTFQFNNDDTGIGVSLGSGASTRSFESISGTGQVVVTTYGNVGGNVVGTFSGKLYGGSSTALDTVTVNGSFNAQRMH